MTVPQAAGGIALKSQGAQADVTGSKGSSARVEVGAEAVGRWSGHGAQRAVVLSRQQRRL